jgi:hypothetical protein
MKQRGYYEQSSIPFEFLFNMFPEMFDQKEDLDTVIENFCNSNPSLRVGWNIIKYLNGYEIRWSPNHFYSYRKSSKTEILTIMMLRARPKVLFSCLPLEILFTIFEFLLQSDETERKKLQAKFQGIRKTQI